MFWNNGITKSNESRLFLLVVIMLSAMILPSFPVHPSLPNIRLDEIVLFAAFGLNVLYLILRRFRLGEQEKSELRAQKRELKVIYIIFGLMVFSYLLSNIYGVYIRQAGYYGLRDVMELVTYLKYFLLITLVVSLEIHKEELDFLSKAFVGGLIFLIIFGWGQHLNLLNMNTWLSPYFNQQHWEHLIVGNPARVLGTFDNPNFFGILTVIALSFLTVRYLFGETKFPWKLFILIGLVIKLEFLTISRTALFGIALLFSILCVWAFLYYKRDKKTVVKIIALFLLTMALFLTASPDFFYRLSEGADFSSSTSFQGHLDRWQAAVGTIWESPVLGWGTQKYVMTTLVDNEYALYARRYGLVGLVVYLSLFLVPFILGWKKLKRRAKLAGRGKPFSHQAQFIAAYLAVLPSILVFNFMAGIFYNLQIMTIFVISMGLVYNSLRGDAL